MTELLTRVMNFFGQFKLLVTILPWERAARVRLGSRGVVWEPGWHIKWPFIDEVCPINSRLRIADTGSQTLTTLDGATLTVDLRIGFYIADPLTALLRMQQPELSCAAIAGSVAAGAVSTTTRRDLSVSSLEEHVLTALRRDTPYTFDFVRVRDFAYARTYRLLNQNGYAGSAAHIEDRKL